MSNILTQNGIKILLKLMEDCTENNEKKVVESDIYMQVYKIKAVKDNSGKKLTQLDVSDGEYIMPIVYLGEFREEVSEGDIIYTRVFSFLGKKTPLITKFSFHAKKCELIGRPKPFKDLLGNSRANDINVENNQNRSNLKQPNFNNNYTNNDYHEHEHYEDQKLTRHSNVNYLPLSLLTTFTKDINILVKISKKYPVKSFQGKNGDGTLFSFNIIDKEGTEMQVTGFTKAVNKFAEMLKEGSVYEIRGGYLKINDRKFATVKSEYKLMIDENTQITEREELAQQFKELVMDYVKLDKLVEKSAFSIIDVIVYVLEVKEPSVITTRQGSQMNLRKLAVVDDSEIKIELTLWKEFCELPVQQGDIISVKSAKVGEFQGRCLGTLDTSHVLINPNVEEAAILRAKMQEILKKGQVFKTIMGQMGYQETGPANTTYLKEIHDQCNTVLDDKFSTYTVKATVVSLKHEERNVYPGCHEQCKKKLIKEGSQWRCTPCDKSYDLPIYYYTFSLRIKDASGEFYLDFFGPVGEKLLNVSAYEYSEMVAKKQHDRLKEISDSIEFKTYLFTLKPKRHNYNNTSRIKLNCFRAEIPDSSTQSQKQIRNLCELLKIKLKI
jgi:replication factor A1